VGFCAYGQAVGSVHGLPAGRTGKEAIVATNPKVRWLRALVGLVITAALSASLVPGASAQIVAPPSPAQVGPFVTVSNLSIDGEATTMAAVAPGANVTITATVNEDRQGYCPGCIAFVPVKLAEAATPAGCLANGTQGNTNVVTGTVTLTAPTTPGVYDVVAGYALQFDCVWLVGDTQATIARIVVTATSDQICALVKSYASKAGVAKALCRKLKAAQRALDRSRMKTAANILHAFRNQVAAQTGKAFTPEEADILNLLVSSLTSGTRSPGDRRACKGRSHTGDGPPASDPGDRSWSRDAWEGDGEQHNTRYWGREAERDHH
jgi:hypothetical protein